MKKTLRLSLIAALTIFFISGALGILFFGRLTTQDLILAVTVPEFRPMAKKVAWAYIRTFGGLNRPDKESLNPIHFAMNRCMNRLPGDPDCAEIINLLIRAGHDINAISNDRLAITPLHGAVSACDTKAIQFLIDHGANVNGVAAGDRFNGMTPLRMVREFKTPCSNIDIVTAELKQFGGHE